MPIDATVMQLHIFNKKEEEEEDEEEEEEKEEEQEEEEVKVFGTQLSFDMCCAVKS